MSIRERSSDVQAEHPDTAAVAQQHAAAGMLRDGLHGTVLTSMVPPCLGHFCRVMGSAADTAPLRLASST